MKPQTQFNATFAGSMTLLLLLLTLPSFLGCGSPIKADVPKAITDVKVEIGCGECMMGMAGNGCDLAIRIDENAYYVDGDFDGANIDDHGDAHADDGFCNSIREALVSGTIKHGRFKATKIEMLKPSSK